MAMCRDKLKEDQTDTKADKDNQDDMDLGFMPSFLESGREPRGRRYDGFIHHIIFISSLIHFCISLSAT
jgi:hypothetical protein